MRSHRRNDNFYPRSPCGERPVCAVARSPASRFLSTLSLRRATNQPGKLTKLVGHFYPRSPCGERRGGHISQTRNEDFYPRSPCGERPCRAKVSENRYRHFYPRSPCGERPDFRRYIGSNVPFLSTLSLRRATVEEVSGDTWQRDFYPRSPCGERLIHPLLCNVKSNFYPRSPCGERQTTQRAGWRQIEISIHALLAESDCRGGVRRYLATRFLSTLSLRRATRNGHNIKRRHKISIHALLAESDQRT